MKHHALVLALALAGCGQPAADPNLGGDTTIFDDGDEAFAYPLRNMSAQHRSLFQIGDGIFNRNWAPAPATPPGNDGLGPTYNAISCSGCHNNNGRAATPSDDSDPFTGLLLRLAIAGDGPNGGPNPDPSYGDQLQPYGIPGVAGEGTPHVVYTEMPGTYPDGTAYSLRAPAYSIDGLAFGPFDPSLMVGPRLAPQMVGLGLLEALDESTIMGFTSNGGHPNTVFDQKSQSMLLGRFGWKANQPSLEQQTYGAFRNDIGITSALFPTENCPPPQTACAAAPETATQPNLDSLDAMGMEVHALGLAIPARRDLDDPHALNGEQVFSRVGCANCHVPSMTTGNLDGWPELSNQSIHPFTDLLLHDMGPGLADGRPDFGASGSEWRTPPLWGLGLVQPIDGYLFLLHDGRARGFEEAILWHDGDAQAVKTAFMALAKSDRDDLIAFLNSL